MYVHTRTITLQPLTAKTRPWLAILELFESSMKLYLNSDLYVIEIVNNIYFNYIERDIKGVRLDIETLSPLQHYVSSRTHTWGWRAYREEWVGAGRLSRALRWQLTPANRRLTACGGSQWPQTPTPPSDESPAQKRQCNYQGSCTEIWTRSTRHMITKASQGGKMSCSERSSIVADVYVLNFWKYG